MLSYCFVHDVHAIPPKKKFQPHTPCNSIHPGMCKCHMDDLVTGVHRAFVAVARTMDCGTFFQATASYTANRYFEHVFCLGPQLNSSFALVNCELCRGIECYCRAGVREEEGAGAADGVGEDEGRGGGDRWVVCGWRRHGMGLAGLGGW